jgi:alpha-tubulin suppressor-like RCC1 family protein
MIITSGTQYRTLAAQNEFNFKLTFTNSTSSGISNFGFSGSTGESLNLFRFQSGKILDLNNRYVWGYNPREEITISGNIGLGYCNYFINNNPVCLYTPRGSGYYDNFYVNTVNSIIDYDFFINGTIPNYNFEYNNKIISSNIFTGYLKNLSPREKSFKVFSASITNSEIEYLLESFPTGILISGADSKSFTLKSSGLLFLDSIINETSTLSLNTNFGTITKDLFFSIYPGPVYFTDFIDIFSDSIGAIDNFTLQKLYNYELQSIYPTNRKITFTLENFSGHNGEKLYKSFEATGQTRGFLSGDIYGDGYLSGFVYANGTATTETDFYNKYPTGLLSEFVITKQTAHGPIIYNDSLLAYGGFATGSAPEDETVLASGTLDGIQSFNGFVNGTSNIYSIKEITLSGYYLDEYLNIRRGLYPVFRPVSFTGSALFDYSKFLWSVLLVTGSGYFSGELFSGSSSNVIGITDKKYFNIEPSSYNITGYSTGGYGQPPSGTPLYGSIPLTPGYKIYNNNFISEQKSGEVLIPLIGQNNNSFTSSGLGYVFYSNNINSVDQILSRSTTVIKNIFQGKQYFNFDPLNSDYCGFIFSFTGYSPRDRGNIKWFSFELDKKNCLYQPNSIFRLDIDTGNLINWNSESYLYQNNFYNFNDDDVYNSSNNIYYFKVNSENNNYSNNLNENNLYNQVRLIFDIKNPKIWKHHSILDKTLSSTIGIKNFQVYRSIPVRKFNDIDYFIGALNSTNMIGYSTISGTVPVNVARGTAFSSQDSRPYPAWHAFNSDKNLYSHAETVENSSNNSFLGYAANSVIKKQLTGFTANFLNNYTKPSYIGVEVSKNGTNYYECYRKYKNIKLSESGNFYVNTGYKYLRLNFDPLPSPCYYAPYSDACFKQTVKNIPYCCSSLWDNYCELEYRKCTGSYPSDISLPTYTFPKFYPLKNVMNANLYYSVLLDGNGAPKVWGQATDPITNTIASNSNLTTIPSAAAELNAIFTPFSDLAGVVYGVGCTGDLITWGNGFGNTVGKIGIIPTNTDPIKKVVSNNFAGLILKQNSGVIGWTVPVTGIGGDFNIWPGWDGMLNLLKNTKIKDISAGRSHMLALIEDGSIVCWGANILDNRTNSNEYHYTKHISGMPGIKKDYSQLFNYPIPWGFSAVSGLNNITQIAAGDEFSLLVSGYENRLTGWGRGPKIFYSGLTTYPYEQKKIPPVIDVNSIAAGTYHGLATYSPVGNIIAWGITQGSEWTSQTTLPWFPPTGVYSIAAGKYHSLAIISKTGDYKLIRWGTPLSSSYSNQMELSGNYNNIILCGNNEPIIQVSPNILSNFNTISGTASSSQIFNINARYLSTNLTITAPSPFEISLIGGSYQSEINLSPVNTRINTDIRVRIAQNATIGDKDNFITVSNSPSINRYITVNGKVLGIPSITTNVTSVNTYNNEQSFNVTGNYLTAPLTITAPTNFEISNNASTYFSSIPLTPSDGLISQTIWIRVKPDSAIVGTIDGDVTLVSAGATSKNIAVSGNWKKALGSECAFNIDNNKVYMDFTQSTPSFFMYKFPSGQKTIEVNHSLNFTCDFALYTGNINSGTYYGKDGGIRFGLFNSNNNPLTLNGLSNSGQLFRNYEGYVTPLTPGISDETAFGLRIRYKDPTPLVGTDLSGYGRLINTLDGVPCYSSSLLNLYSTRLLSNISKASVPLTISNVDSNLISYYTYSLTINRTGISGCVITSTVYDQNSPITSGLYQHTFPSTANYYTFDNFVFRCNSSTVEQALIKNLVLTYT